MKITSKRHAAIGSFALLLVCSHCTPLVESSLFSEEEDGQKVHQQGHYLYQHEQKVGQDSTATGDAVPVQGVWGADGTVNFERDPNVREDDDSEDESSTSSSEKGKENTTSDSKPSSTDDSSFPQAESKENNEESSTSSSEKGKENTTSDSKPSSTDDSSFKGPANGDGDDKSSGSSSTDNDTTSDTNPSSTDDSSVEDKEDRDAQDDQEADDPVNGTKADACQVPSNGLFGSTSSGGRGLQFFFQIETATSVNETLLNNVLLPVIEAGIAGRILALLFTECRQSTSKRWLRRSLQETCEAKGFSSLPVDRVLSGVPCVGEVDDSTRDCVVIDGGARLYLDAGVCSDAVNRSKAELKQAMNSGALNDLDRRILNITYVEEEDLQLSTNDKTTAQSGGDSGGSTSALPAYAYGIIGAGVFIILSIILWICCKRRPKDYDDEMRAPLDQGEGQGSYVDYDPPSDQENPYFDSQERQSVSNSQAIDDDDDDDSMLPPMEETSGEDTD